MRRLLMIAAAALLAIIAYLWWSHQAEKPQKGSQYTPVSEILGGSAAHGFQRAIEPRKFHFPEDHGPHQGFRNEWWYFTGNLESREGRSFGYQLTFFRVALSPRPLERESRWGSNEIYMAHFAVTDIDGKRFRFAERFSRAAMGLAGAGGSPLAIRLEDWSAVQESTRPWGMKLVAADPGMAIDLDVVSLKPEILNGEEGLSRKGATVGNASYYYSIPRMRTTGYLRSGDTTFQVSGITWLDREWSTSALERDQVGWDWFALHLDDGRDIMFYRLRRRDGSADPHSAGTVVAVNGAATPLGNDEVRLEVSRWWKSDASGSRYPSLWRLTIPSRGIDLQIEPRLPSQELLTSFRYWEGAVALRTADGKPCGSGYLEMTGY